MRACSAQCPSLSLNADTGRRLATTMSRWLEAPSYALYTLGSCMHSSAATCASPYSAVPLWLLRSRWSRSRSAHARAGLARQARLARVKKEPQARQARSCMLKTGVS